MSETPEPRSTGGGLLRRNHPIALVLSLLSVFLVTPAFERGSFAAVVFSVVLTLVVASSALSNLLDRRTLLVLAAIGLPYLVLEWLTTAVAAGNVAEVLRLGLMCVFLDVTSAAPSSWLSAWEVWSCLLNMAVDMPICVFQ